MRLHGVVLDAQGQFYLYAHKDKWSSNLTKVSYVDRQSEQLPTPGLE
jgi:hypothetical protein